MLRCGFSSARFCRLRSFSSLPAYEIARAHFEKDELEQAHSVISNALKEELQKFEEQGKYLEWDLPFLTLELGKSFLKNKEARDAIAALTYAVTLFEQQFDTSAEVNELVHKRFVETLLHLAKLEYLTGGSDCEVLWKRCISYSMKNLGREAYEILVATNGLAEYYLEHLKLGNAERFSNAAAELARELREKNHEEYKNIQERLVEAITMQGLTRIQQRDYDRALKFYNEAMGELEALERSTGLDNFSRVAFFNLYRNLEHVYKQKDMDEEAVAVKKKMEEKLGSFHDVELTQQEPSIETAGAEKNPSSVTEEKQ